MIFRKGSPLVADEALGRVSPGARALIESSRRGLRGWGDLVTRVGPESAVELVEVAVFMGMVDAADDVVSQAMRRWRVGGETDASLLAGIAAIERDDEPRVRAAVERVKLTSTRPESAAVAEAGSRYYSRLFGAARSFVAGGITESEMADSLQAKQSWHDTCDRWSAATGSRRLPLVGD